MSPRPDSDRSLDRRAFLQRSSLLGVSAVTLGGLVPAAAERLFSDDADAPSGGGETMGRIAARDLLLENSALTARWTVEDRTVRPVSIIDRATGARGPLSAELFSLALPDGGRLDASAMRIVGEPTLATIAARRDASRAAEQAPGRRVTVVLEDDARRLHATWRAELRDGARYLRQEVELRAHGAPLRVTSIALVDLTARGATVTGTVKGSPVTIGPWYTGFEHPLSTGRVDGDRVTGTLDRELPLQENAPFVVSSVIGVTRPGQMRRDFLAYVERERAHPYRPFLHYNSWYDIGYFSKYDEAAALAVIDAFGTELARKRGVVLDSFLFDDGWDDPRTLWGFHGGFPRGFARVKRATARYGAAPGVWMSPWGGYGDPKKQRLEFGRAQGFETNEGGFSLSGPKYYERFRETCLRMVRAFGVNQFKFDGTGNAARAFPGSRFDSDFDAAIHLIDELRREKAGIYVNLTTGTYPSPFWLRHADSIWRGGEDHDFAGVGTDRQQWITYRDADTYENVVKRGALFPLNSLMLHGLVYARHAKKLGTDPGHDFSAEVRSYFGTGTQLQEMYITPTLTSDEWDVVAESARWARRNAGTLVDTHWLGGDPKALDVYGWASWSPRRGIITLRNPHRVAQRFPVDVGDALELPGGAPTEYAGRGPYDRDRGRMPVRLRAGVPHPMELAPFEVVTLELTPV